MRGRPSRRAIFQSGNCRRLRKCKHARDDEHQTQYLEERGEALCVDVLAEGETNRNGDEWLGDRKRRQREAECAGVERSLRQDQRHAPCNQQRIGLPTRKNMEHPHVQQMTRTRGEGRGVAERHAGSCSQQYSGSILRRCPVAQHDRRRADRGDDNGQDYPRLCRHVGVADARSRDSQEESQTTGDGAGCDKSRQRNSLMFAPGHDRQSDDQTQDEEGLDEKK